MIPLDTLIGVVPTAQPELVRKCFYCGLEDDPQRKPSLLMDKTTFSRKVFLRALELQIRMPVCSKCFNAKHAGTGLDKKGRPAVILAQALTQRLHGLKKRASKSLVSARHELSQVENLAEQYDAVWIGIQKHLDARSDAAACSRRAARDVICSEVRKMNSCRTLLSHCFQILGKIISLNYAKDRREADLFLRKRWVRDIVMFRDGHKCIMCGISEDLTLDHSIPVSRGGENRIENLQTLCRTCNAKKGEKVR